MRKGIFQVVLANIIYFCVGLISNFILPKCLPIETYSDLKLYTLYLSYAGLLTLGYVDGIFLKYGGKKVNDISKKEFNMDFLNFIIIESIISILLILISFIVRDVVFFFFAIGLVFENAIWYYRMFFQAVGEFKTYGKILNSQKVVLLTVELILIIIFNYQTSNVFLIANVFVTAGVFIYFIYLINKKFFKFETNKISFKLMFENVKKGILLTLGNFANTLFTGIDRWFVKFLFTTIDFAIYAFAVSMENIVNLFVTPISVSLYNYVCKNKDIIRIKKIKKITMVWGVFIIILAFPAKFILENFLIEYINANLIIFFLFATQAFYAIIKGIYVNLYKANLEQNKYLKQTIIMIIISILLNIVIYFLNKSIISFAIGTFIASIIWFFICENDYREIMCSYKEYIYLFLEIGVYILSGLYFNSVNGFILYFVFTIICTWFFMKDVVIFMKENLKDVLKIKF